MQASIFTKDFKYFKNIKYFIIDCLRYKEHPSHFNLSRVLSLIKDIATQKNYFNQSSHRS